MVETFAGPTTLGLRRLLAWGFAAWVVSVLCWSMPSQVGAAQLTLTADADTPDHDEALLEAQESDPADSLFSPPLEVILSPEHPLAIVSAEAEADAATEADRRVEVANAQGLTPGPLLESLRRADTRRLLLRLRARLKARAQGKGAEDGLQQNP